MKHDEWIPEQRFEVLKQQKEAAAPHIEDYLYTARVSLVSIPEEADFFMSDDSEDDNLDNSLPNLSKVITYLTNGEAFHQLRLDLKRLSNQPQRQIEPKRALFSLTYDFGFILRLLTFIVSVVDRTLDKYRIFKSRFWSEISPYSTRLQWTCVRSPVCQSLTES